MGLQRKLGARTGSKPKSERVDSRLLGKEKIEKLIKAGAFDRLGGHRAQQFLALPRAIQSAYDSYSPRIGSGTNP